MKPSALMAVLLTLLGIYIVLQGMLQATFQVWSMSRLVSDAVTVNEMLLPLLFGGLAILIPLGVGYLLIRYRFQISTVLFPDADNSTSAISAEALEVLLLSVVGVVIIALALADATALLTNELLIDYSNKQGAGILWERDNPWPGRAKVERRRPWKSRSQRSSG